MSYKTRRCERQGVTSSEVSQRQMLERQQQQMRRREVFQGINMWNPSVLEVQTKTGCMNVLPAPNTRLALFRV